MQLGTRWAMGSEPPARLPEEVVAAIREVESAAAGQWGEHGEGDAPTASSDRRWTLTWLEGRPIAELDPAPESDEITTIRFNPADRTASITSIDSGDEWVEEEL